MSAPFHRLVPLTLTLAGALAVAGCGGGSTKDSSPSPSVPTSVSTTSQAPGQPQQGCRSTVTVTGKAATHWTATGQVTLLDPKAKTSSAPAATYQSATKDGKGQLTVYSSGPGGWTPSVTLSVDDTTYSGTGSASALDAATDGGSAKVDLDVNAVKGPPAHVSATFTCNAKIGTTKKAKTKHPKSKHAKHAAATGTSH